ncbi:hypothetical protein BJV78DRAFT_1241630 [Lactifluus subvellereus]|nr:hypothetical protein BJV78DRAFT_1241630 [Lactifluus subvellereus]
MAQPIFNEHPLQDYLRQSGDVFEPIPGAMSDLSNPFSEEYADDPDADLNLWSWLPTPVLRLAEFLNIIVTSVQNQRSTLQEFSERFKYDVISSSLLSSSITAPSSTRRRSYPDDSPSHDSDLTTRTLPSPPAAHPPTHRTPTTRSLVLVCLSLVFLSSGSLLLCILFGTVLYYVESHTVDPGYLSGFITPTLSVLNDLISAAHLWDSTVQEAINLLELEESATSSMSPSSPLRVALHSSLHSTQAQSDNVRHVLAGLASPSALAQLSGMYAPPSPMKPHTPLRTRSGSTTATLHTRSRSTWNGNMHYSYAALARAGSPTRQSLKRWERRRSDVSALLLRPSDATMSAPVTPLPGMSLEGVEEERGSHSGASTVSEQEGDSDAAVPPEERGQFASAALELRRQRRSRGIGAFLPSTLSPPPKGAAINSRPPHSTHITRLANRSSSSNSPSPRSSYPASRFTAMQMPRHPLSIYSLTLALNGALAARRHTASHLLALRFGAGDGLDDSERWTESYWEDVRSVMALLTSALANATAPLIETLDAGERERLLSENPTPPTPHSPTSSEPPMPASSQQEQRRRVHRASHMVSFAPLPSHLSRFAAHVDGLTNALNDARSHLESCVASLRDGGADVPRSPSNPQEAPALQAYERLRRELGLALRECERGREPLLELLRPPPAEEDDDDEEDEDSVPALGLDAESSDSDKDPAHVRSPLPSPVTLPSSPTDAVVMEEQQEVHHDREGALVVGLERLPPPGIEQVFEADADADADGPRPRPRSKLSRAERIAAVKARRANALPGLGLSISHGHDGGDQVELKDVIWKVGEQRRQRERQQQLASVPAAIPEPSASIEDVFTSPPN